MTAPKVAILAIASAATAVLLVAGVISGSLAQSSTSSTVADTAFVTVAGPDESGCRSLSTISISEGVVTYAGEPSQPYSRIVASLDFERVVTGPNSGGLDRYHVLQHDGESETWEDFFVWASNESYRAMNNSATYLSEGGSQLFAALYSPVLRKTGVGIFDLMKIDRSGDPPLLGDYENFIETEPYLHARALKSSTSNELHLIGIDRVSADAVVQTVDVESKSLIGEPIAIQSMVSVDGHDTQTVFASLSPDDRFIVTNQWFSGALNVVDMMQRTAYTLELENTEMTGGVAFNRGWHNNGLLAVHARDHVLVIHLDPQSREYVELGRVEIAPPKWSWPPYHPVPAQLAWSTSGAELIAIVDDEASEFAVFDVSECGKRIELAHLISVCSDRGESNFGLDILTANGYYAPPDGQVEPCIPHTATPLPEPQIHLPMLFRSEVH